jgi:cytochrome c553
MGFCAGFLIQATEVFAAEVGAARTGIVQAGAATEPPAALAWAYPRAAQSPVPAAPPGEYRVPGSTVTLSQAQISDEANPPDWFPHAHPPAPPIVAHGMEGGAKPCATCHLFNGAGFLGVPDLAGLPAAYIVEQMHQFRAGSRRSAERDRPAVGEMIGVAAAVGDADLARAAAYYAALPRHPWVRVVEADRVPATQPDLYGWLDLVPGGATEPIGGRIIEVAEDTRRMMWLSDPHSGVVAYVPRGAVARGDVAAGGGFGAPACAGCHGAGLRGEADVPALAGRSPAYLARALWDIKTGARRGPSVARMQPVAAALSAAEITDVVAYLASLKP